VLADTSCSISGQNGGDQACADCTLLRTYIEDSIIPPKLPVVLEHILTYDPVLNLHNLHTFYFHLNDSIENFSLRIKHKTRDLLNTATESK
jgi:hypothetical protein